MISAQCARRTVGGFVEVPLWNRFGAALRASYSKVGTTFSSPENIQLGNGHSVVIRQIDHIFDVSSLLLVQGQPYITFRLIDMLTLYAGVSIGVFVQTDFSSVQRIDTSQGWGFRAADRTWSNEFGRREGRLPVNNPFIAFSGGANIEMPIDDNGQWFVAVEAFYNGGLTPVIEAQNIRSRKPSPDVLNRSISPLDLGTQNDPNSGASLKIESPGSWLLNNVRLGASVRFSPFVTRKPCP